MTRIIFFFSVLLSFGLKAQITQTTMDAPVSWSFALSRQEMCVGDTVEMIAKGTIVSGWYLYSNDFDPSLGPVLTEFSFTADAGYKLLGKTKAIHPKKKYDATFSGDITYFVEHAEFRQKIIILNQNPAIGFSVEYQACSDALGRCVPGEADHIFKDLLIKPSLKKIVPEQKSTPTQKKTTQSTNNPVHVNTSISQLESEKQKLIQKDANGNDVTVDYLKNFVKKYGK
jgi:hypothetical protein